MGKVDVPDSYTKALKNATKGIVIMISVFVLSGIIISFSKNIAFGEAITFALAFATHGGSEFADANTAIKSVYIILSFGMSVLIFYIFYILIDLSISGKVGEHLQGVNMMNKIKNMKDHYIICGAGRVGINVGEVLARNGQRVVFVEKESDVINNLKKKGHSVYESGPIDEEILSDIGVDNARAIIASLGDDSKNLLLVLTARHINPNLLIAARIKDKSLIPKFKHAGANLLIIPETIGGIKLAEALMGQIDHAHVIQI